MSVERPDSLTKETAEAKVELEKNLRLMTAVELALVLYQSGVFIYLNSLPERNDPRYVGQMLAVEIVALYRVMRASSRALDGVSIWNQAQLVLKNLGNIKVLRDTKERALTSSQPDVHLGADITTVFTLLSTVLMLALARTPIDGSAVVSSLLFVLGDGVFNFFNITAMTMQEIKVRYSTLQVINSVLDNATTVRVDSGQQ